MDKIIMFLCSILYKKYKKPIFCIKGTGKEYPQYLIYTQDERIYKRMDEF